MGAKKRRQEKHARELAMLRAAVAAKGDREVARELGVAVGTVRQWLSGARSCASAARKIAELYGASISIEKQEASAPPLVVPPEDAPIPDTAKVLGQILAMQRDQLARAKPDEFLKASSNIVQTCNALSKISGQREPTEVQVIRSKAFRTALGRIERALEGFPGAWSRLAEAFAEVGRLDS